MKILVVNCGSSSLKYQLLNMANKEVLAKGNYERIGQDGSFLTHKTEAGYKTEINEKVSNHNEAIKIILNQLLDKEHGVISDLAEISGVGHRVVHGGEKFTRSVIVDDDVIQGIEECAELAPLHNPGALHGIRACRNIMPNTKMVVVFDTAFHQTLPEESYMYPIPYKYYKEYKIRRYGFHGTSHKFVSRRVSEIIGSKDVKMISCHLGQGASLCAIKDGLSIDTSMGFTPLAGIPMGTRCGDIDPSIVTFLMKKEELTPEQMDTIMNKESGAFGLSGVSPDFRDIEAEEQAGNERAKLALNNYAYTVAQYIGKYAVSLNGLDVITFCAGIGENGPDTRRRICEHLEFLGVKLDLEKNDIRGEEREISAKDSKVKVYIIPTNEELMIAQETMELI